MVQSSWPYTDQATSDIEYSRQFRELQDDGVVGSIGGNGLKVYADASGMNVFVPAGDAFLRGYYYRSTELETIAIDPADANARIDRIILRLNLGVPVGLRAVLAYKKGTPSPTSPQPPALLREDDGIWEVPLARVAVGTGAVTISNVNVTPERRFVGGRVRGWTNDTRPEAPRPYTDFGFNTDRPGWEYHNGTDWVALIQVSWSAIQNMPTYSTLDGRKIFVTATGATPVGAINGDIWLEYI